jgi:hypothetical protein
MSRLTHLAFFFLLSGQLFSQSACSNVISQVIESDCFRDSDSPGVKSQVCEALPFAEGIDHLVYLEKDTAQETTVVFYFDHDRCTSVEMRIRYRSAALLVQGVAGIESKLSLHYDLIREVDPTVLIGPAQFFASSLWEDQSRHLILTAKTEPLPEVVLKLLYLRARR